MRSTRKGFVMAALAGLLALALVGCGQGTTTGGSAAEAFRGGSVMESAPRVAALQSGGEPMPRTISVNGMGMASARPDVADIHLGVETIHTDAGLAISENTGRMTAVMDVLKAMGVEDKDVQTTQFSMWIEEPRDQEGRLIGERRYHVVNQVRVRLRDLTKTGEFLQKALAAGANNVGGVSFSVADPKVLERQARDLAIADAKAKAEQLAAGLGAKLGPVHQVSEYGGVVKAVEAPMAERALAAGAPVPISGGEFSVTVEVQVTFGIAE